MQNTHQQHGAGIVGRDAYTTHKDLTEIEMMITETTLKSVELGTYMYPIRTRLFYCLGGIKGRILEK